MAFIADPTLLEVDRRALEIVPHSIAWENAVLPVSVDRDTLHVVLPDVDTEEERVILEKLEFILNRPIEFDTADRELLHRAIEAHYADPASTIEACGGAIRHRCSLQWADLTSTRDARVRTCHECEQLVFLCLTVDEVRAHAYQGHCVVLAEHNVGEVVTGLIEFPSSDSPDVDDLDFDLEFDEVRDR